MDTQAVTVRLPVPLHERLRREAFEMRTSQAAIITDSLTERYARLDRDEGATMESPGWSR